MYCIEAEWRLHNPRKYGNTHMKKRRWLKVSALIEIFEGFTWISSPLPPAIYRRKRIVSLLILFFLRAPWNSICAFSCHQPTAKGTRHLSSSFEGVKALCAKINYADETSSTEGCDSVDWKTYASSITIDSRRTNWFMNQSWEWINTENLPG